MSVRRTIRAFLGGILIILGMMAIPGQAAADTHSFSCTVPAVGAQRCGSFEVPGKQSVRVVLHSSEGKRIGFCIDAESNGGELGDCRAVNEGETSAVLWTNPDPGRVAVSVRANADRFRGSTEVRFSVRVD
ncbi:MAG: hypothetical protein ACT4RN_02920 [Pseudonocardia sp.]